MITMITRKQELEQELALIKQQEQELKQSNINSEQITHPYCIGMNYFIRTVTYSICGKLDYVGDKELRLTNASWVADQGTMTDSLRDGLEAQEQSEIELFSSDVIVGRGSIIDATIYQHDLPTKQK